MGMIILAKKGDSVPCDGILLYCGEEYAYVETKSLDGETNLKRKHVHPIIKERIGYVENRALIYDRLEFHCEAPNNNLLSFSGIVNSS